MPIIKRESLAKQVADELEAMIEGGEFEVGDKIPTEPELMELFGVSRNTVREAIKGLTITGILETKQGNGTFIRSSSRFQANMKKKYESVSLEDIKEARGSIEATIAYLAALRYETKDFEVITEMFKNRQALTDNLRENTKADMEFHMAIAQACHNGILIDLYQSMASYLETHITEKHLDNGLHNETVERLHKELYEALAHRQAEEAARVVHHIINS